MKFKYPLHYPPLIPNLDEEIDLVSDAEMLEEDDRIPILLVTQFGFHTNRSSDKEMIKTIVERDGKVGLLYRGYLSRRQVKRVLIAEASDLRDVSPESLFLFTTCCLSVRGFLYL
jgi:hypothetical protein